MNKHFLGIGAVAVAGLAVGAFLLSQFLPRPDTTTSSAHQDSHPMEHLAGNGNHEAFDYAVAQLGGGTAASDGIWWDAHLSEILPNQRFSLDGAAPAPAFEKLVYGRVTDVAEGAGFSDGDDGEGSTQLPFDSPEADWRAAVLHVAVANDFDTSVETPKNVKIVMSFSAGVDPEKMKAGLQDQVILVAAQSTRPLNFDPAAYQIGRSGALLGFVDADGNISMPLLDVMEKSYLGDLTTIDRLAEEAEKTKPTIKLETRDMIPTRVS